MYNVSQYGQVFTPPFVVDMMLNLRKNQGTVLEPSAGAGAFFGRIPECVGIELDATHSKPTMLTMDFFDFPITQTFDTIIGNPPYVRYQDILSSTKKKLNSTLFDERSNLYLFFIEKCIRHLNPHGELIFITPRDFIKATSSIRLNHFIYENGTITDFIELGDKKIFEGFSPNCVIWRFEKDNFSRQTHENKIFMNMNEQLIFTSTTYTIPLNSIFNVKVGAVSGCDEVFAHEELGNEDFVCSSTYKTGQTKRMILNAQIPYLEAHKEKLIQRKIRKFDENNWWQWGRLHHISNQKRIYVNAKTRSKKPFFIHDCLHYDGAILALFPHRQDIELTVMCEKLNEVHWEELGFVCGGRYLFSQRSLNTIALPSSFEEYRLKKEPKQIELLV